MTRSVSPLPAWSHEPLQSLQVAALTALIVWTAALARAQTSPRAYTADEESGDFFSIDLGTGALTRIGPPNTLGLDFRERMLGLSFGPDGKLYGLTSTRLMVIDAATGSPQTLGAHKVITGQGISGDLALHPDGTLYGTIGDLLLTFDLKTGLGTFVATTGRRLMGGLLFGLDGQAYLAEAFSGDDALYRRDLSTGVTELVGAFDPQ